MCIIVVSNCFWFWVTINNVSMHLVKYMQLQLSLAWLALQVVCLMMCLWHQEVFNYKIAVRPERRRRFENELASGTEIALNVLTACLNVNDLKEQVNSVIWWAVRLSPILCLICFHGKFFDPGTQCLKDARRQQIVICSFTCLFLNLMGNFKLLWKIERWFCNICEACMLNFCKLSFLERH